MRVLHGYVRASARRRCACTPGLERDVRRTPRPAVTTETRRPTAFVGRGRNDETIYSATVKPEIMRTARRCVTAVIRPTTCFVGGGFMLPGFLRVLCCAGEKSMARIPFHMTFC